MATGTPSDVAEGLSPLFELEIRADWIETGPEGELPPAGQWVRIDAPIEGGAAEGSGPGSPGDRAVPTLELLDRPDPGLNGSNVYFDAPNARVGPWTEVAARCASAGSLSREESSGASKPVKRCEMIKLSVSDGYTLYSELWRTSVARGYFSTCATASSLYARRDDTGNCCPSGGSLSVQLKLVGRRLVIEEQTYHPPDVPPDSKVQ